MEDFRSKWYGDGRTPTERHGYSYDGRQSPGPTGFHDLRCFNASHASSAHRAHPHPHPPPKTQMEMMARELKLIKGKKYPNGGPTTTTTTTTTSKSWIVTDPELLRKKRVASYESYTVEGRVKGSLRKSFGWLKDTFNLVVHGWR